MKTCRSCVLAVLLCVVVPAYSSADVKILLKNGRSLVADSCGKVNGKLLCQMQGGTMEIELKDIAGTEEVKGRRDATGEQRFEPMDEEKAGEQTTPERPAAEKKGAPAEAASGEPVKGLSPEQSTRLAEINRRKADLKLERENLIQDRDQLYADIKSAGVIRTQEQFDGIKKRIADLEARIIRLNEEVKKLNDEEAEMFEGAGPLGK
jgi:hypothetical protein